MGSDDTCNLTGLALGLGFSYGRLDQSNQEDRQAKEKEKSTVHLKYDHVLPSLSLGSLRSQSSPENTNIEHPSSEEHHSILDGKSRLYNETNYRVTSTSISPGSSYSNSSTFKKEKFGFRGDDFDVDKAVSSRASDEDEEASPRKKLRLTKDQSVVLEDSFKEHSTLNPNQKQALARQLNLRPRQVEVWFQNRRARTKLKQTEMDCDFLKKCCESLTEENKRLHRELQELRAVKLSSSSPALFMQMPAATLNMCPACERINATGDGSSGSFEGTSKVGLVIRPTPQTCSPFARSSTAC